MKRLLAVMSARRQIRNMKYISVALAVLAALFTVAVLILPGKTLTYKKEELECTYEIHRHTDACYTEMDGQKILTCGYADYVIHQHTEDCYEDGILVCTLPEISEHKHTDSCYKEQKILICGQEDLEGHEHTEDCYQVTPVLVCGQQELHTHTRECYDEEGRLICGLLQLEEHIHGPECFKEVEMSAEEATELPVEELVSTEQEQSVQDDEITQKTEGAETENITTGETGTENTATEEDADGNTATEEAGTENTVTEEDANENTAAEEAGSEDAATEKADAENTVTEETDERIHNSDRDLPAQSFEAATKEVTVSVSAPEGAFPDGTSMKVKDIRDEKVIDAISDVIEDPKVSETRIQAVDVTFVDVDGKRIEPAKPIRFTMSSALVAKAEDPLVLHVDSRGNAEIVEQIDRDELEDAPAKDEVVFDAEQFSVYAIVGTTIEKNVLASDGKNYRVSVTYGEDAGIPAGAELEVSELSEETYEDYLGRTEVALDAAAFEYARIFDISIIDREGNKIQPRSSVQVTIDLLDVGDNLIDFAVVHFAEEEEKPEQMDTETDGNRISFSTDGFSAYAVVQGPSAIPLGWSKISSLEELFTLGSSGLYIGHTDGYYLMNTITADDSRSGITKTKPANPYPADGAALYYFEQVSGTEDQVYVYYLDNEGKKQYVYNNSNNSNNSLSFTDEENRTAFTVTVDNSGRFTLNNEAWYWNMQGGANGSRFCAYYNANDSNNKLYIWQYVTTDSDSYGIGGKSYGLMNWNGGAAGKAMMAASSSENSLDALALTVMTKTGNNSDKLYVPDDSDITMWSFEWISQDQYYLKADVDGSTRYLKVQPEGLSLVSEPDEGCRIKVVPGTGTHAGEICLKAGNTTLTYSGSLDTGFTVGGSAGSEWLRLVEISELTTDYQMTYSASKVSVSDESVTNESRIIVYTRVWDDTKKKYVFYAIDHDGSLVPCYESGDDIQWVGSRLNTLLWNFVEYYWEGTEDPNYYYELYNQYSGKYIAPQASDGQILSDDTIGINLNGRRNGQYYSTILAWDEEYYAYAGLKADMETGRSVSCPISEADDFYFAVMQDINLDDDLTTVETVDHTQYGITMKIVDFGTKTGGWNEQDNFLGSNAGGAVKTTVDGLLSTNLGEDNYPKNRNGDSLADLYANAQEVNHLFIKSTYSGSGYYEYDSTQNFASLIKDPKDPDYLNFKVYKELGTMDGDNKNSLKHGQFMPYNDLAAGVFAATNPKNLYNATIDQLPDSDPRKYEQMYLVKNPDYYFGVELEASFTQPPNGLDDWGHDIIYEFTGDDDFWLYVDGELIIDLGGIHSALAGSVNYSTGEVVVNGKKTTLREIFEENYRERYPEATDEAVDAYLAEYFDEGSTIFKDYTTHTMRIFYMERGAGASNLHMRFNLASIKPGTVQLSKNLSGVDTTESVLAEFPYQIIYTKEEEAEEKYHYLTNAAKESDPDRTQDYVFYKDTITPVKYEKEFEVDGVKYNDVFFLKPGEVCDISFPEGMKEYKIVECGVNTNVYKNVAVNGETLEGSPVINEDEESVENRKNYEIGFASTEDRARVVYTNEVDPDALRTISITKKLYREDGKTELEYADDDTSFNFRLYLASEFDELDAANMHTYHVKDPNGNYCRWDVAQQKFVSLGEGKGDYTQLSDEEKKSASFSTSMNGAISKIAAGYMVEVRDVLAGTKFKVVERTSEIPDGYSFQKYIYMSKDCMDNDSEDAGSEETDVGNTDNEETDAGNTDSEESGSGNTGRFIPADTGVSDIVKAKEDPYIEVCNLRGWGLRVNKVWSDADYMTSRDAAYFAVFTRTEDADGKEVLTLVPDTVRKMDYGTTTLYWYWLQLPVASVTDFDRYEVREVTLTGTPVVDDNGIVKGYEAVTPLKQDDPVSFGGMQKGESSPGSFEYTVLYSKGEPTNDSHVRVDTVINNRPGIVLKKTMWDGVTPLAGAVFSLKDADGNEIGRFTSDSEGQITVAFLSDDKDYILTETKAPQGYHALETPMKIRLSNGTVTISNDVEGEDLEGEDLEGEDYILEQGDGETPVLTIKNRSVTFRALKKDGDTNEPLAGVHFALHRWATVENVTSVDLNPMPGYEDLVTDSKGILPKINNMLPAGTYQLREKSTISGYQLLSSYIDFTVSETGAIHLDSSPEGVKIDEELEEERGGILYTLSIPNSQRRKIRFEKVDIANVETVLQGAEFDLYQVIGDNLGNTPLITGLISNQNGLLAKDDQTVFSLPMGVYHLVETKAPAGYNLKETDIIVTVTQYSGERGVYYDEGTTLSSSGGLSYDAGTKEYTLKISNSTGYELPATGGAGTKAFMIIGFVLTAFAGVLLWGRRKNLL